jgi:hypothetical protein
LYTTNGDRALRALLQHYSIVTSPRAAETAELGVMKLKAADGRLSSASWLKANGCPDRSGFDDREVPRSAMRPFSPFWQQHVRVAIDGHCPADAKRFRDTFAPAEVEIDDRDCGATMNSPRFLRTRQPAAARTRAVTSS